MPMRPFCSLVAVVSLLGFIVGCGRHETAVQSGNRTQVLHFGNGGEPRDLDPQTNIGEPDGFVIQALFEGLVGIKNDGTTIIPAAAERWVISPDGKTYTFSIRANAQWTNGERVTAQDFESGFMRLIEPALGCEAASQAYFIEGAREYAEGRQTDPAKVGIKAIDIRTFEIKLINRTPFFLSMLASWPFMPVQRGLINKFDAMKHRDTAWTKPANFVGNGRFRLKEWKTGQVIEVEKNSGHWDSLNTKLNGIRFYPIEDQATEEHMFRAGQLHVTNAVPEAKVAGYKASPDHEFSTAALRRTHYVTFNTKNTAFHDERVRRAFALAIDRDRLVTAAGAGISVPAFCLTRPATGGYTAPITFKLDVAEARRLMAAAGYPEGKGFPAIECMLTAKGGSQLLEGEVLQQMWTQNLGVHVSLQPTEWKVYLEAIRSKKFQCVIESWGYIDDPWDPLQLAVTNNPNNDADWSNPAYDRAFADAERAPDDVQRRADFDVMEKLLAQGVPYAPLSFTNRARLVQASVQNWHDTPIGVMNWVEFSLAAK